MSDKKGKQDWQGEIDGVGYKASFDNPAKWPASQIPPALIEQVARVLGYGAQKYSAGNWLRGMSMSGVMDAVLRHLSAWQSGEQLDPESGLPHLAHASCGLAFLLHFQHGPRAAEYARFDDRLFKPTEGKPKAREEAPVIAQGIRDWLGTNNAAGALDSIIADIAAEESLGPIEGCPCGECRTKQRAGVPCRDGETIR